MKRIISVFVGIFTFILALTGCSKAPIERGTRDEISYKNQSIGITFDLPSGWSFYTDEQVANAMGISTTKYKKMDLLDYEEITFVIDFVAVDKTSGTNVNMTIEKLTGKDKLITTKRYIEKSKEEIMEEYNVTNIEFSDVVSVNLGSVEFDKFEISYTYYGVKIRQFCYIKKKGSRVAIITITTNGNNPEEYESYFS